MKKLKNFIKENKWICIILILSIILHSIALIKLGPTYTIESDDIRYIESGKVFKNKGVVSIYNDHPTAQIMPGITYIIGIVCLIFGEGFPMYLVLKIVWLIFSLISLIGIYKIVLFISPNTKYSKQFACIATIPLLFPSFIWMDNVILTETPYMCFFILTIYFTLKEGTKHSKKNFIMILMCYLAATLLRANFAIYPIFLIIYLLLKNYDKKLLIKEILIATFCMCLFFIPWIVRNYNLYHEFIPLTYGSGNPKFWGTYQGYGYPNDEELDFDGFIKNYDDENMQKFLNGELSEELTNYYSLKLDDIHANYRINAWWQKNKVSFLISYCILKPIRLMAVFYWQDLFGINNLTMQILRGIALLVFLILFIIILIKKSLNKEIIFLLAIFLSQVAIYSWTFTFSRYGQTLVFILYIIIGYGLNIAFKKVENVK